jgi:hypothetical protein
LCHPEFVTGTGEASEPRRRLEHGESLEPIDVADHLPHRHTLTMS